MTRVDNFEDFFSTGPISRDLKPNNQNVHPCPKEQIFLKNLMEMIFFFKIKIKFLCHGQGWTFFF